MEIQINRLILKYTTIIKIKIHYNKISSRTYFQYLNQIYTFKFNLTTVFNLDIVWYSLKDR